MAGFGDALKYLYEKFILRDVLSFVTPGAIIVLTSLFLFYPNLLSRNIPWPFYIPLFGVLFLIGFATQCFGEFVGLIYFSPPDKFPWPWHQRLKILSTRWTEGKDEVWWINYYRWRTQFLDAAKGSEREEQNRERQIVLKQMCANGLLASVIAAVLFLANHFSALSSLILFYVIAILLLLSLFWGHRVHVLRQYATEKVTIDSHSNRS
jgi:hypothetical protein